MLWANAAPTAKLFDMIIRPDHAVQLMGAPFSSSSEARMRARSLLVVGWADEVCEREPSTWLRDNFPNVQHIRLHLDIDDHGEQQQSTAVEAWKRYYDEVFGLPLLQSLHVDIHTPLYETRGDCTLPSVLDTTLKDLAAVAGIAYSSTQIVDDMRHERAYCTSLEEEA